MTSYSRRRSVHWRPLQGLLGCLGPNPATTDCIMWRRLFVLVNVCPRALRHFLDDILLLEALTGRAIRTAGVGFTRPPSVSLFRGFLSCLNYAILCTFPVCSFSWSHCFLGIAGILIPLLPKYCLRCPRRFFLLCDLRISSIIVRVFVPRLIFLL